MTGPIGHAPDPSADAGGAFDETWLARNSVSMLLASVLLVGLGVAQSVIAARLLGARGKGELFLVALTGSTAGVALSCSLGSALQVLVGNREVSVASAARFASGLTFAVGSAAMVVTAAMVLAIASGGRAATLVLLTAGLVPAEMLQAILMPVFVAADRIRARNVVDLVTATAGIVLLVVLVSGPGDDILGAVGALTATRWASCLAYMALLWRHDAPPDAKCGPRPGWQRRAVSFGLRQHGATLMARGLKRADSFLLASFLGVSAVGVYSVASTLAELPLLVARALNPAVTSFVARRGAEESGPVVAGVCRVTSLALIAAAPLYAVVVAVVLRPAFGRGFGGAFAPFLVLLLSTLGLSAYSVLAGYLVGVGRPGLLTLALIVPTVANVVLSLVLIPTFGLVGNAAASAVTGAATLAIALGAFRRLAGLSIRSVVVPRRGDRRWMSLVLGRPAVNPR